MSRLNIKIIKASMALLLCFFTVLVEANTVNRKVLVLGDSLSAAYGMNVEQGWVSLLSKKWQAQDIQLINASISGNTSVHGLNRLPLLLAKHKPDIVIIELGGNDGLQGKPIKHLKNNLNKMISLVHEVESKSVLFEIKIPPNYGQRYTKAFTQVYSDLANNNKIPLIPFFIESVAYEMDLMQSDGIHPKAKAQKAISQYVEQQLQLKLPELKILTSK